MEKAGQFSILSITISNEKQARKLSALLLKNKLCACVHIIPKISSMYWWKGKINTDSESWMVIKTHRSKVEKLESFVQKHHPYDIPEILEIGLQRGSKPYLDWLLSSIGKK